jgi:branched-chain amino acid transport system ATP-binding protein
MTQVPHRHPVEMDPDRGDRPVRLEARGVSVQFEGLRAVADVDLSLDTGEVLGLIGPNGAGKTTLVNVLSGFQKPTAGDVVLGGKTVTRWTPQRLARSGVVRTFQAVRAFRDLSVRENIEIGAVGCGLSRRRAGQLTTKVLDLVGLSPSAHVLARALPHGQERRLGIARALASRPRFLLLDEPAAGLNEVESDELIALLRSIPGGFGCGVLVIEHEMRVIMNVSHRVQVLDYGKTISIGTPEEVRTDPAVLEAYLGSKETPRDAES